MKIHTHLAALASAALNASPAQAMALNSRAVKIAMDTRDFMIRWKSTMDSQELQTQIRKFVGCKITLAFAMITSAWRVRHQQLLALSNPDFQWYPTLVDESMTTSVNPSLSHSLDYAICESSTGISCAEMRVIKICSCWIKWLKAARNR